MPLPPPAVLLLGGVPLPLTVYGFDARGDGVEQHRPVRAELQFTAPLGAPHPTLPLQVGLGAAVSTVLGARDGPLQVETRFTTLDAGLLLGPYAFGLSAPPPGAGLTVGLAPALLFEHLYVDDGINLDTVSLGLRARARLTWPVGDAPTPWLAVLDFGWERYTAPLDRATYYNHRLGPTELASVCAGAAALLP